MTHAATSGKMTRTLGRRDILKMPATNKIFRREIFEWTRQEGDTWSDWRIHNTRCFLASIRRFGVSIDFVSFSHFFAIHFGSVSFDVPFLHFILPFTLFRFRIQHFSRNSFVPRQTDDKEKRDCTTEWKSRERRCSQASQLRWTESFRCRRQTKWRKEIFFVQFSNAQLTRHTIHQLTKKSATKRMNANEENIFRFLVAWIASVVLLFSSPIACLCKNELTIFTCRRLSFRSRHKESSEGKKERRHFIVLQRQMLSRWKLRKSNIFATYATHDRAHAYATARICVCMYRRWCLVLIFFIFGNSLLANIPVICFIVVHKYKKISDRQVFIASNDIRANSAHNWQTLSLPVVAKNEQSKVAKIKTTQNGTE